MGGRPYLDPDPCAPPFLSPPLPPGNAHAHGQRHPHLQLQPLLSGHRQHHHLVVSSSFPALVSVVLLLQATTQPTPGAGLYTCGP